jgi:predicted outer membrane protein
MSIAKWFPVFTLVGAACATGAGRVPTPQRFIAIPCAVSPARFVDGTRSALIATGWTITSDAAALDVEASKPAIYRGAGENIIVNGPYRFAARLERDSARVIVQSVRMNNDGTASPGASFDDGAPEGDRRNFVPALDRMRAICRGG